MIVSYKNNIEDVIKGYEKFARNHSMMGVRLIILICFFLLLLHIGYFGYRGFKTILPYIISISFFYFLSTYYSKFISKKLVNELVNVRPGLIGNQCIEVFEDKIVLKSENDILHYNIKSISSILGNDDRVIFYVRKFNPIIIIPYDAFNSKEERKEFIHFMRNAIK